MGTPYGKPIIGYEEHIQQYTKEDALNFYQNWYVPNNAILVIAGDVNIESLKTEIQHHYGSLKPKPLSVRHRATEPKHRDTTAKIEIRDPKIAGAFFQRIYPAPNFRIAGIHQEAALTLLQDILGDGTYGKLTQALVENQKLAHFITAHYTGYYYDPYSFTISASPINSSDLSLLETSIEAEIRRIIFEGVTENELNTAKQQWEFESQYRRDSLHGMANYFGENISVGYTFESLEKWLTTIQAVTKEDIKIAAKNILNTGPTVTIYAHPVIQK